MNNGGIGLGINVDVSNQTFWVGQKFEQLVRSFLSCMDRKWENRTSPAFHPIYPLSAFVWPCHADAMQSTTRP